MSNSINTRAASAGDVVLNASRQLWLASLGAAVVTRDWAGKEATTVFRNLVREGTTVESRAFRVVGDRIDTSFTQANALWKHARRAVTTTVRAYADSAATLVRETLPVSLPIVGAKRDVPAAAKRTMKRSRKAVAPAKQAKRTVKRSVKRAGKRA